MTAPVQARHLRSLEHLPYEPPGGESRGRVTAARANFTRAGWWLAAATLGGLATWALDALHAIAPITTGVGR